MTDPHPDQRIEEAAREIAREITHVGGAGPDEWNALVEINRLRLRPMLKRFHDAAWDAGKKAGFDEGWMAGTAEQQREYEIAQEFRAV